MRHQILVLTCFVLAAVYLFPLQFPSLLLRASKRRAVGEHSDDDLDSLPAGGGGVDAHYFSACSVALAGGVARNASRAPLALPPRFSHSYSRNNIANADYTRTAVWAAWAELLAEEPALSHAPRAFLSTAAKEGEEALFPWTPASTDLCDYALDAANCDMHTWRVDTPLNDVSRAAGATTGHAQLAHAPYDLIILSQTFEHLFDPPLALARVRALLAPGGLVFISLPGWNIAHLVPSHQQGWSPCGAFAALSAAGFDVLRVGWFHSVPFSKALANPGAVWPGWKALGVADPFVTIPPGTDAGLVNTVWVLARAPASVPFPPPPLEIDASTRPLIAWSDMLRAQTMRGDRTVHSGAWPTAAGLASVLARMPRWLDGDVAHLVLAAAIFERLAIDFGGAGPEAPPLLVSGPGARLLCR